jgi:hypothetical protein
VTDVNFIAELHERTVAELSSQTPLWFGAIFIIAFLCWPKARLWLMRYRSLVNISLFSIVAGVALAWAWSLLWASDDAYITFRYAENLVNGHGLVFNPGERVEGYTDFLWAILAAVALFLKGDPGQVTIVINLVSFVVLLMLVERLGKRMCSAPTLIGLSTILLAANYTMASFATACIEAMFAAMLVTLAVERVDAGHAFVGGLAGIFATLSHPDHALFYAVVAGVLLLDKNRHRDLFRFLIPFVVVYVPYFAWRWHYYGDFMPNTFYAKSADKVYFSQGLRYLLVTFVGTGMFLTLPLVVVGGIALRRTFLGRFSLIILPVYLGYVAKVGGDFMLGRFFVAALPFWFLLVDAGYRVLLSKARWKSALILSLPASVMVVPISVIKPGEIFHGIADERTYGRVRNFAKMDVDSFGYSLGHRLHRELASNGILPKMALWCIGMSGYYSKLPVFDLRGLTSRSVARLPIAARGRPGHEKKASAGLVVESGAQLSEIPIYPEPYANLGSMPIGGGKFFLVRYEPKLIDQVRHSRSAASVTSMMNALVAQFSARTPEEIACDLWYLEEYYFTRNLDEVQKERILRHAIEQVPTLAGTERLLLEPREPTQLGYQPLRRFSFEGTEGGRDDGNWKKEGTSSQWVESELVAGQDYPLGRTGSYVNTFLPVDGNAAVGRLSSPTFVLTGDVITLTIGGGLSQDKLRVSLVVDEQLVRSATGCNTDWMGKRVWNIVPFRGKAARVTIEDISDSALGHLVVDEMVEWKLMSGFGAK